MNRRNLLKTLGISIGTTVIGHETLAGISENSFTYSIPKNIWHKNPDKPVTAITLGAGSRGTVYGDYAAEYPKQLKIVGVADPNKIRNERYAEKHGIIENNRFTSWEQVFSRPKFADAIIISTPDNMHYKPCMKALEMGYDILLEKPIAPTERECRDILKLAKKTGRIVAVCHVLRYAPYFVKMRDLIAKGAIGEVLSVQHLEPIGYMHMAHSYVRGNWHNSKETTPIIMAKSCHDLDIIKWIINKPCQEISAMGDLKWFKIQNAPEGSTERCTDGCAVERDCPFSAIKIYKEKNKHTYVFDLPDDPSQRDAAIMQYLKTTNYGRCVYRMNNDQPDHYISNIKFADNITASFSMESLTADHGRRTRVMGSMGELIGDMKQLVVRDFRTDKEVKLTPKAEDVEAYKDSGHGGGDWLLVRDFVQAVSQQNAKLLTSTIDESIESHIMAFMAEESRKTSKVMKVKV